MYNISERELKFDMKIALPMSHRVHSAPRASLSTAITQVSSRFSMRVQDDGASCGVMCAQMMEYCIHHNAPPRDAKHLKGSSNEYRDTLLTMLCDGLKLVV
jgi:hypothetical protein